LALLLERKQLLDDIQVNCNARTERHTEQQEHRPHLVLNADLTYPLYDPSVHMEAPSRSLQRAQEVSVHEQIMKSASSF
jgi:hypothetical protein